MNEQIKRKKEKRQILLFITKAGISFLLNRGESLNKILKEFKRIK